MRLWRKRSAGSQYDGQADMKESRDARMLESKTWRYALLSGLVKVLIGILCLFHLDSTQQMSMIYSPGLIHSAIYRIVSAFRKNAIVYLG